jgi:hypothetical protein
MSLDAAIDAGYEVWATDAAVWDLTMRGHGELLLYDGKPVRWRRERSSDAWPARKSDVRICRIFEDDEIDEPTLLGALGAWADELAYYGAAPCGSLGSAAWSLFRATLRMPVATAVGDVPPIRRPLGGRQEKRGENEVIDVERAYHWDLPAAYPTVLASVMYGGRWRRLPGRELWLDEKRLCFVQATVEVPEELGLRPLPDRRPGPASRLFVLLEQMVFPAGRIKGCWALPELRAALETGARLIQAHAVYVHEGGWEVFASWGEAAQKIRSHLHGEAKAIAKASANSLWGQFCLGSGVRARVRGAENRRRQVQRLPRRTASRKRAPELGEWITASVRAALYLALRSSPSWQIAHTDGFWSTDRYPGPELPWKIRDKAHGLRALGPQMFAWRPAPGAPWEYHVSGAPRWCAAEIFEQSWNHFALTEHIYRRPSGWKMLA